MNGHSVKGILDPFKKMPLIMYGQLDLIFSMFNPSTRSYFMTMHLLKDALYSIFGANLYQQLYIFIT